MSIEQMRDAVIQAYKSSTNWKARVLKMSDTQVVAIFYKFRSIGKIKI